MDRSLVLLDTVDVVGTLTLNHPEKRNALSMQMLNTLKDRLKNIAETAEIKVLILKANGPVFSAGHDLRELVDRSRADYAALFELCTEVMEAIRRLPIPVIAQVDGLATAAGCQLVASCDLVLASERSSFATPGVKIGLFCTTPAVALVRAVPVKKAMEMLLTGKPISATEAERCGLVNRVVTSDNLSQETMELACEIAAASASVIAMGKQAFYKQLPLDHAEAYNLAQKTMVENALIDDAQEGMHAFLEKRKPKWKSSQPTICQT